MNRPGRSWGELLSQGKIRLEDAGISEPAVKLRWVAAYLLRCNLMEVLTRLPEIPPPDLSAEFGKALSRLEQDEPVQYVIGETDFMGLTIHCDPRALIPRPETEELVLAAEEVLNRHPDFKDVADVCTGSGCIACALAHWHPGLCLTATDLSSEALELARSNAKILNLEIRFLPADLLAGVPDNSMDVVISNPPYVTTGECDQLPRMIRDREPRMALDGGADGLRVISRLVSEAARVLRPAGVLLMEIGEDQADAVRNLICQTTQYNPSRLKSDCAGRDRIVQVERRPPNRG